MAMSEFWHNMIDDETPLATDAAKVAYAINFVDNLFHNHIQPTRTELVKANTIYNQLMDANKDNPNSHYAKTTMLYGRKFCGMDVIFGIEAGVTASDDRYKYGAGSSAKPYIDENSTGFDGYDNLFHEHTVGAAGFNKATFAPGDFEVEFNCWDGNYTATAGTGGDGAVKRDYFKETLSDLTTPGYPATESMVVNHAAGTIISVPTIQNLDTRGSGVGTNTYELKPGFKVAGWKLANNLGATLVTHRAQDVYIVDDIGHDYIKVTKAPAAGSSVTSLTEENVIDNRVFRMKDDSEGGERTTSILLPLNRSIDPPFPFRLKFILAVTTPWIEIGFKVPFLAGSGATPSDPKPQVPGVEAPAHNRIKTQLDLVTPRKIRFPLATMLIFEEGYELDTGTNNEHPFGQWSLYNPSLGTWPSNLQTDKDIYGNDLEDGGGIHEWDCNQEAYVGNSANQVQPATAADPISGKDTGVRWYYLKVRAKTS